MGWTARLQSDRRQRPGLVRDSGSGTRDLESQEGGNMVSLRSRCLTEEHKATSDAFFSLRLKKRVATTHSPLPRSESFFRRKDTRSISLTKYERWGEKRTLRERRREKRKEGNRRGGEGRRGEGGRTGKPVK